jgi:hypothetical protein
MSEHRDITLMSDKQFEEDLEDECIPVCNSVAVPTRDEARAALSNMRDILQPLRSSGGGHRHTKVDDVTERRLGNMKRFLAEYILMIDMGISSTPWTYAALHVAKIDGHGPHLARNLGAWTRTFIRDCSHSSLPGHHFGHSESHIHDEDHILAIREHISTLDQYFSAQNVVDFIKRPEILDRFELRRPISLSTATNWLHEMGYTFAHHKGLYYDGHERKDVVDYRQGKFIPMLKALEPRMGKWDHDGHKLLRTDQGKPVNVWSLDQSTF